MGNGAFNGREALLLLELLDDTDDEKYSEFLEEYRIRSLIKKYSDYIRFPIRMEISREKKKEGSETEYETEYETVTLNSMTPIWKKHKNELTDEDYNQFYREKFYDYNEPLLHLHNRSEGTVTYNSLLYIPAKAPYDFYTKDYEKGLQRIGFSSVDELIKTINEMDRGYYPDMIEQVDFSIKTGELVKEDHLINGVYFTYYTKCIAETDGKAMLAASIQTYGGDVDKSTNDLFEKYSRMLIDTYDHISVMDPAKNTVITRLYSKFGFSEEYTQLPLDEAIRRFAENEVAECDRERFLQFMEPSTIRERMNKINHRYFQLPFQYRTQNGEYKMMDTKVIKVFMGPSDIYIFSIEAMSEQVYKAAELLLNAHPELFDFT